MDVDETETNDLVEDFPEVVKELTADWENWIQNSTEN